jgi:hypothetical protein
MQKSSQDLISTNSWMQWHASVIPAMEGSRSRSTQEGPGKKHKKQQHSISKKIRAKGLRHGLCSRIPA